MKKAPKIVGLLLSISIIMILFSCQNNVSVESTANVENSNMSYLAEDPEFKNSVHIIRNEDTNTSSIIKGDGTILLKSMRPFIEDLSILKDEISGEARYLSKHVSGDNLEYNEYFDEYEKKTYRYPEETYYTEFYDLNGNEIGLKAKTYVASLAVGDNIFYRDYVDEVDDNLYVYNVKTKKSEKALKSTVGTLGSYVLISSDGYGANAEKKEILVCDENLNVVNTIENYSYRNNIEYDGVKVGAISTVVMNNTEKDISELQYNVDYTYKYNYLDENCNLIFDEPVDNSGYFDNSTIVTFHRDDIEFDFDFKTKKVVGDMRPYSGFDNYNSEYQSERAVYSEMNDNIRSLNPKYNYVDTRICNNYYYDDIGSYGKKILFLAHYSDENENYDDPAYEYKDHCDVYSINGELLTSFDNVNVVYEDEGYILVNYDTLYNFDLEVVKAFDEKVYVERHKMGNLIYFTDEADYQFNSRPKYNIYDKNMEVLYENVISNNTYAFDDKYFVVAFDDLTQLIDENLKVFKEYDTPYEIDDWYDVEYKIVKNLKTNRMGIMDKNYNIIIKGLKSVSDLEEKSFTYANGFKYGLMDYEGKVICNFSIFDTMSEDAKIKDYDIKYVE